MTLREMKRSAPGAGCDEMNLVALLLVCQSADPEAPKAAFTCGCTRYQITHPASATRNDDVNNRPWLTKKNSPPLRKLSPAKTMVTIRAQFLSFNMPAATKI